MTPPAEPDPVEGSGQERDRFRDWPAPARYVVYAVGGLVVLLVLGLLAGALVVRRSLPQTTGTVAVPGLDGRVQVRRDVRGVPQIYAGTTHDLFYAQGYVQAQDRFWQMDYRRHAASGRLSELFGRRTLASDLTARTLGWRRVAEQEYASLSSETRDALDDYSEGVNAWLKTHSGSQASLEYSVLAIRGDYQPEPWKPVDSLAWLKAFAWDLAGDVDDEVTRTRLAVGKESARVGDLYPPYPYADRPPIVPDDGAVRASRPAPRLGRDALAPLVRASRALSRLPSYAGRDSGVGSNSWVVSGRLTTTGAPLLADDPHFAVSQPGATYQTGLHCRSVGDACPYDVSGFSFAGFPGVAIGHTAQVAWGMTNLHADTADLYLEKVDGKRYLFGGRMRPLQERDERIAVAGGETRVLTVRSTRHGPLVSDVSRALSSVGANAKVPSAAPDRGNGYAVAVSWTGLTPGRSADALLAMDRATDTVELRDAAADLAAPAVSIVYAGTAGGIGYQATGAIPLRRPGHSGALPARGWLRRDDVTGRTIPVDRLPHVEDPASGVIVAANQAVVGPAYPYRVAGSWDYGYRSARILRLLRQKTRDGAGLSVADMSAIQADTRNPMAPVLVPYLRQVIMPSPYYAAGQRLLDTWDYGQPADSAAAAYFNAVWRNLLALTFHDQLPEAAWPDGSSRWLAVVARMLKSAEGPWWDDVTTDEVVENRDLILEKAMEQARDELVRRQSHVPREWRWGDLHRLGLDQPGHVFGDGLVRRLFDRDGSGTGGGAGAVDATSWDPAEGYAVTTAPAMRMVVDLGDLDRSRWVNLAGASGHAFGAHYTDQLRAWRRGETYAWPWREDRVRAATVDTLTLRPSG